MGPLGKPFFISPDYERIAVVGGGIGVFPLLFLLETGKRKLKSAFLGFRSKEHITLMEEFKANSGELTISTDDGSFGEKGLIIDPFIKSFKSNCYDIVYACGPLPMLKAICEFTESQGVPCQVSLEQRMGCGIGACLVCACKTRDGEEWKYSHVCKDGPVFWSRDVIFD
jgi:dihydroorotate dehydrogenase electron transfer subunit